MIIDRPIDREVVELIDVGALLVRIQMTEVEVIDGRGAEVRDDLNGEGRAGQEEEASAKDLVFGDQEVQGGGEARRIKVAVDGDEALRFKEGAVRGEL